MDDTNESTLPCYLWCDLETTGLDPTRDEILEIAIVITGADLVPVETWSRVLPISPYGWVRLSSNETVLEMHRASGLLAECRLVSGTNAGRIQQVERELLAGAARSKLDEAPPICLFPWRDGKPWLAGTTVQFDRGFLAHRMPAVTDQLHYRQLDVRSVERFMADAVGVALPKGEQHRALADVTESIDHYHQCRAMVRGYFDAAAKWYDVVNEALPALEPEPEIQSAADCNHDLSDPE